MAVKIGEQDTGSVVYQATEELLLKSNIYCEIPYCSADSRTFVYERTNPASEPNPIEYVICEFGTWETQVGGCGLGGPAITHEGLLYFRRMAGEVAQELVRLNLSTGASEVIHDFPEGLKPVGLGTMSLGERYFAYGVAISYSPKMFGIELLDLNAGTTEIINTDPDICNPHTQFEPSEGKHVMVQHNRGCEFLPDGTRVKLVGEEGATEYLLDIPDGKLTRLQVGKPYTTPITGHESWIGDTKEILLSVGTDGDFGSREGQPPGCSVGFTGSGGIKGLHLQPRGHFRLREIFLLRRSSKRRRDCRFDPYGEERRGLPLGILIRVGGPEHTSPSLPVP